MNQYDNYYAAVGRAVVAQQIVDDWIEGLRELIVNWCVQNRVQLVCVGVQLFEVQQTPNGPFFGVHVAGFLPNRQVIHLTNALAPWVVAEAIGVVCRGYPTDEPQMLFDYEDLFG